MKILIADDHALFRDGLEIFLDTMYEDIKVIHAKNYEETFSKLKNEDNLDLLILDLDMPDMSWEDGLQKVVSNLSGTNFFVMSAHEDLKMVKKSLELGAKGYISKKAEPKILENALKLVLDGGVYLPSDILQKYIIPSQGLNIKPNNNILTVRQREVLSFIARGMSNKQIAYELKVTESTVKLHINALLKALNVTNRTQAVVEAQKRKLI